jgi:cellulose biosynthesis protein BcsQ
MSRIFEALRIADRERRGTQVAGQRRGRDAAVVTLASTKGGVGRTVLAANLAVDLAGLAPDRPVLLASFDDDPLVERMFSPAPRVAGGPRCDLLAPSIQSGRYGVHYLLAGSLAEPPFSRDPESPSNFERLLRASDWSGLVVADTTADLGPRTRSAILASDLVLVPVADRSSLDKAGRLFDFADASGLPRDVFRIVLSQIDLRIKYRAGEDRDVLALLVSEIRRRGWPLLETFVSRTAKIASLYTNPETGALPVAEGAPGSVVHQQLRHLAADVDGLLSVASRAPRTRPAEPEATAVQLGWLREKLSREAA